MTTTKELAEFLNGKTEKEIDVTKISIKAENSGLVIVYGASDDLIEFRGAIFDEGNCDAGGEVVFTKKGVISNYEDCVNAIKELEDNGYDIECLKVQHNKINALWCPNGIFDKYGNNIENISWAYKTKIPHYQFNLMKDGEVYCIGIVFSIKDLK